MGKVFAVVFAVVVVIFSAYVALRPLESPSSTTDPVSAAPTTGAADTPERVAFIGDSYTQGAGGSGGGFVSLVAEEQDWAADNLGVGGTGYMPGGIRDPEVAQIACARAFCPNYPEMIDDAAQVNPDIVIVSGGRNNIETPLDDLRAGIAAFYRELRKALPDADIYATSPLWDSTPAPATLAAIGGAVKQAVEQVGGRYLDLGQPLRGRPALVSDDEIHPNDDGYRVIADVVLSALS